jgi:hypothetical protein
LGLEAGLFFVERLYLHIELLLDPDLVLLILVKELILLISAPL